MKPQRIQRCGIAIALAWLGRRSRAKLFTIPLGLVLVTAFVSAHGDPLDDAKSAYLRGDYSAALTLFEDLQKHDVGEAEFYLGEMYVRGLGVTKDSKRAVELYRQAASKGLPDAETQLGVMYSVGSGVPLDLPQALGWFQKASIQGYGPAQSFLGTAYLQGQGTNVDVDAAVKWLTAAAEREVPSGQYVLASLYLRGIGVRKDWSQALAWLKICASNASNADTPESDDVFRGLAGKKAEVLAASMTPAQIAKTEELIRQFHPLPVSGPADP
jgi:TPR repeat protein